MTNNNQILNISYHQSLSPEELNKIFYNLFTPGVIEGIFKFTTNTVTITSVAFLIHPQNKQEILVRIDTTDPITLTNNASVNTYLVARYRWENANIGAEFLFVNDATIIASDVILVGLTIDTNGLITALDYDVQERAKLKVIQKNTAYPLISKLDGYVVGHNSNEIPVSDGVLNTNLNAQLFDTKEISQYAVSKELPVITTNEDGTENITYPILPTWMNSDAIDAGEGITSEFIMGQKIQPQDGSTEPGPSNQIPVANTVLQKNLNSEFLSGHLENEYSKTTHKHNLDEIIDNGNPSIPNYYKVGAVVNNFATADSIEDDDIDYTKVAALAYDSTIGVWYKSVFETGTILLTDNHPTTVTFQRPMKNTRIILQRAPASTETVAAGAEKRTCRITSLTNTGFKVKQMGSIIKSGVNYLRSDVADAVTNQYYWFCVGEKV